MYFTKPIARLTFQDVVHFLKQGVPENTLLDYKYMLPKDNEKFAKTIAAFANSMGGTVIIGVKDEHDKPKPPFSGIAFHGKIRGQIESIIQNYIDPIVFVDIATCKDPNSNNMFVVVNIPQSNLTPHLVGRLKRAYIRTGQASRPEVIVHPDTLPWLMDNRRKSQNLRHILIDKAEAHFNNFLRSQNTEPSSAHAVCGFTLLPLYPQTPITDYKKLPQTLKQASFVYRAEKWPREGTVNSVQDGIVLNPSGTLNAWEFNCYGLISSKTVLADENNHIDLNNFYLQCVLFFKTAARFYEAIGYISPLLLRVKISNARGSIILSPEGERKIIEDYVRIDRNVEPMLLSGDMAKFCAQLLEELSWSLNLPMQGENDGLSKAQCILDECKII